MNSSQYGRNMPTMMNDSQSSQFMDMMKMQQQQKLMQNIAQLAGKDMNTLQAMVNVLSMQAKPQQQQFGFSSASPMSPMGGNDLQNNMKMMSMMQQMNQMLTG